MDVTEATLQTVNSSLWTQGSGSTIQTPGGVNLTATYSPTSWQTVVSVGALPLFIVNNSTNSIPSEISRVAVLRVPSDLTNNIFSLNQVEIVECTVGLAAYSYSGVYASGNEFNVNKTISFPLDPGIYTGFYQYEEGEPSNDTLVFNQTGLPVFTASMPDISALSLFFNSNRFGGNIYDGESPPAPPQGMGDAFRTGNISQAFQNMAKRMTDQLRSSYDKTASGVILESIVFVHVQWEWLYLPLFVQISSAVFLLLVLAKSRRARSMQLWKSSLVAMLHHEVTCEGDSPSAILRTDVENLKALEALAKSKMAKLE